LFLIVIEGHGEIVEEAQCLVFIGPEAVEEVAHGTLLAPTASRLACGWRERILCPSFPQQRLIRRDEIVTYCLLQTGGSG
jgi:hypothetical protein